MSVTSQIEAILFASGEPVPLSRIAEVLEIDKAACRQQLDAMIEDYSKKKRGIVILNLAGSNQMATAQRHADIIAKALEKRRNVPLSGAAMEILTIIAYNQPVSKAFVEHVRGVDSSHTVNALVEKGLVEESGRLDIPGRPIAYRTSAAFLRSFGLSSLSDLPPLPSEVVQLSIDQL